MLRFALLFAASSLPLSAAFADPPPWAPAHGWRDKHDRDDDDWRAVCAVARDASRLRDPRFATPAGRLAHAEEIELGIAEWTRGQAARAIMATLQHVGVPAGVVLRTDAALHDPHLAALQFQRTARSDALCAWIR